MSDLVMRGFTREADQVSNLFEEDNLSKSDCQVSCFAKLSAITTAVTSLIIKPKLEQHSFMIQKDYLMI